MSHSASTSSAGRTARATNGALAGWQRALRTRDRGAAAGVGTEAAVTIRHARPSDAEAIERLAGLDSRTVPAGPLLVAEVDGRLWAAVQLDGDAAIADPFRRSGELVHLLAQRARQLRRETRPTPRPSALSRVTMRLT